jgi:hypothetical protein
MADAPPIVIEKEMGFTRLEFFNQFKFFSKEISYTIVDNAISISLDENDAKVIINLNELSNRILGSLKLPRLSVQFIFNHCSELQQKEFIKKFDTSFQKGGG